MKRYSDETNFDIASSFAELWNRRVRSIRLTGIAVSAVMILLGILLCAFPGESIAAIETLAALLVMALGIYELVEYFSLPVIFQRGGVLINSILNIFMGILLLVSPVDVTIGTFSFLFGFLLMTFGIDVLALSGKLRYFGAEGYGWVIAIGVLSIIAAFLFLLLPLGATLALNYILAFYLLICGITLLVKMISTHDLTIRQ